MTLDTNVFIGALASPHGAAAATLASITDRSAQNVASLPMLEELRDVLGRAKWSGRRAFDRDRAGVFVKLIEGVSQIVEPANIQPVCRDPDDDIVLATAVSGEARYVVTNDLDLLVLRRYERIRIVTPADFLGVLRRRQAR